jgi:hypothetical protein
MSTRLLETPRVVSGVVDSSDIMREYPAGLLGRERSRLRHRMWNVRAHRYRERSPEVVIEKVDVRRQREGGGLVAEPR